MARYQVILAYDGTRYQGFQKQVRRPEAPTIQGVFETALHELGWQGQAILAAGRTDTGVHASGQVVAFDLEWKHVPQALQAALNAHLPADVIVQAVLAAAPDFHPRYDALSRHYRYRIYCRAVADPLRERYAWRVWPLLAVETLQEAAVSLVGRHDFAAYGTPPRSGGSTVRTIFEVGWRTAGMEAAQDELVFDVRGDAFLYHMVRRLVFIQVAVGQGRLETRALADLLADPPRFPVQGLAPAKGLTLVEVTYR
jgi:tRNA pseudouridine38-40 synthase